MTKVFILSAVGIGAVNCILLWALPLVYVGDFIQGHTRVCLLWRATHIEWVVADRNTGSASASVHHSEGLSTWRPLPSPDSFFPQYSNGWLCSTYLHTISKTPGWRPKTQVSHRHQLSEGISISARIQRSNMIWSPKCLVPISYQEFE